VQRDDRGDDGTGTPRRKPDPHRLPAGGNAVFYPTAVPIPVPGTWRLTGRAGANLGCFVVTFRV
jgi:hypothetical protein